MSAALSRRWVALALLVTCGCASSTVATEAGRVSIGTWGGEHVLLTVTADGAHLDFDCASGDIMRPLTLDSNRRLAVDGVFLQKRGGPIRLGQEPDRKPARYAGHLRDNTLTFDVVLLDSRESVGSFTAIFGATPRLVRCL